jgi:NADH-quinone oxidoreductase subunit M
MAWSFFIAGMSSLALPGLSSFVSEFLVLVGTYTRVPSSCSDCHIWNCSRCALRLESHAEGASWTNHRQANENLTDLNLREKIAIAPVIAVIVALGFYPAPLLNVINPASAHVIASQGFTDPVPSESAGK